MRELRGGDRVILAAPSGSLERSGEGVALVIRNGTQGTVAAAGRMVNGIQADSKVHFRGLDFITVTVPSHWLALETSWIPTDQQLHRIAKAFGFDKAVYRSDHWDVILEREVWQDDLHQSRLVTSAWLAELVAGVRKGRRAEDDGLREVLTDIGVDLNTGKVVSSPPVLKDLDHVNTPKTAV